MAREDAFDRLISKEIALLNRGLAARKTLKDLLSEKDPATVTKDKGDHAFDRDALRKAAELVSEHWLEDIRLPIYMYVDSEIPGECYIPKEASANLIRKMPGLSGYRFIKGKMWIPRAIAAKIRREYPTLFQYYFLP